MITLLTGENTYLLRATLQRLVDEFVAEYTDMGLERLDGEEASFDRMREAIESLPFLAPKKMVLLLTPGINKEFAENAAKLLSDVPEVTEVVIVEPKPDKRTAYYKFLKKHANIQEFKDLDTHGLALWLTDEAAKRGGTLSRGDARYLVERVHGSQQLLSHELDKLLSFSPNITKQTIDSLTDATPQSTIFELLDAALAGNTNRAVALYDEQRRLKVEPQQIIAMLAWQLHVLAVVKVAGERDVAVIAKEAKLNPFVVRKSQGLARQMTLAQVKELVHDTLALDIRLKSQPVDADDALKQLLLHM